ncbi:MAG: chemotaxis-specific protein-glutamate methyltransferase CheB [Elusimicrobiota bacterium]|jgi:two-component system chemotaxis response regulator CheB
MNQKVRILVVDDAVVVRRLANNALSADPDLVVVGTASNGRIALARIPEVNPDLILLDMEMPEMDGLQTLAEIRKTYPRLPIIMFSTQTRRGAVATLDALSMGASDYVTKPNLLSGDAQDPKLFWRDLTAKIKALCLKDRPSDIVPSVPQVRSPSALLPAQQDRRSSGRVDVVAIGVSTGGPNALAEVLPVLPPNFPVPVVVVQHMPPLFTRLLAERLSSQSHLRVIEAVSGDRIFPGSIWVAPGDYHMVLERHSDDLVTVQTNQNPPENWCRPSVDVLFKSVAETYVGQTLAVILTGMGQDGLRGCETIASFGGQIIAQDEATSVVWGMPGFVVHAGLAEKVLPLREIAPEIIRRVQVGRSFQP